MPVFALYNFDDLDATLRDAASPSGAQNGLYLQGAAAQGGMIGLDGADDVGALDASPLFQMAAGTLKLKFQQDADADPTAPFSTVLSRDSAGREEGGGFSVQVKSLGNVVLTHETPTGTVFFNTGVGFMRPGDEIEVSYSWNHGGAVPGLAWIRNLTQNKTFQQEVPNTLTMDMGAINPAWVIGAGQDESDPTQPLNNLGGHFDGKVDYLSFSDTVDPVGPPIKEGPAATPDVAVTDEDVAVTIDVLQNDSHSGGAPLTVTSATAAHGQVVINSDGTLTYQPDADYNGPDQISYTVTDPAGQTSSSTVTVTVNPINDAPEAVDDFASTRVETPVVIDLLANDRDVDGDTLTLVGVPTSTQGQVEVLDNGQIAFTPASGFTGTAVIDYQISDGQGGTDSAQAFVTVTPPDGGGPGARDGIVWGHAGNDLIDVNYTGDNDGDFIDADDAILSGAVRDDDFVIAGGGDDTILSGEGNDIIFAGSGNDMVDAGFGHDTLMGEGGDDSLRGGGGDDLIDGGIGDDSLFGDSGNDTLLGGDGDDFMDGSVGDDALFGGRGDDTLIGGPGSDSLFGGDDRDYFHQVTANDYIDGNEGGDDFDVLDLRGGGRLRVEYDDDNPENGIVTYLDRDGAVTGETRFVNIERVIPCFTPGTQIATPRGLIAVEDLRVGDRVITRDNGVQEIAWVGARDMTMTDLTMAPHLRPVRIAAGSLGHGLPERDLLVSPNHRLLIANERTSLYFDDYEVLVAAKHLVGTKGLAQQLLQPTTYIHFMCAQHEVVLSNGAWTETFQPGDQTLRDMGEASRSEIYELFPELRQAEGRAAYGAARRTLRRYEANLLLS